MIIVRSCYILLPQAITRLFRCACKLDTPHRISPSVSGGPVNRLPGLKSRPANMIYWQVLYKEPTRCSFGSIVYQSLQNYSTCFGGFLRPSSGVLTGRLPLHYCSGNRPRTSLLDIYLPDTWHAPVAASTVVSTPDDGCGKRPKHVE